MTYSTPIFNYISSKHLPHLCLIFMLSLCINTVVSAQDEHEHEHDQHEEDGHVEEGRVHITAAIATTAGIQSQAVGEQTLHQRVLLYGKTVTDPQRISHIRARYPGIIQQVNVSMGDQVAQGDALLKVEANNSLQSYTISSPIAGTVIQRHANPGEAAADNELLTIANYQQLWVELNVFPAQASEIKAGQQVRVMAGKRVADIEIRYLTPTEHGGPSILARAQLDNRDQRWTPDLMVEGAVTVAEFTVPLAVDNRALHSYENQSVVFVQNGEDYEARPLSLGRDDGNFTEVLAGLQAGEHYVVANSYLIKADLEKAGAAHHH
jgi:cobalt-zinc-cadmium efflux system membrane fusion protein